MARQPRLVVPGHPHHLIQRGHNGAPIVRDDEDRRRLLDELRAAAGDRQLRIHAYVLMDNHLHLLATPAEADDLGRAMQALGRRYVGWFNQRHGRSGGLWDGRFRAAVVEVPDAFLACQCYIELNPVRAGLVVDAEDHPWSSARHHLGLAHDPLVADHPAHWALGNTPFEREAAWRERLRQPFAREEADRITRLTLAGKVLGGEAFVRRIAEATDRTLVDRPRGRPKGSTSTLRKSSDSVPN